MIPYVWHPSHASLRFGLRFGLRPTSLRSGFALEPRYFNIKIFLSILKWFKPAHKKKILFTPFFPKDIFYKIKKTVCRVSFFKNWFAGHFFKKTKNWWKKNGLRVSYFFKKNMPIGEKKTITLLRKSQRAKKPSLNQSFLWKSCFDVCLILTYQQTNISLCVANNT
jgi:hypothetical protein